MKYISDLQKMSQKIKSKYLSHQRHPCSARGGGGNDQVPHQGKLPTSARGANHSKNKKTKTIYMGKYKGKNIIIKYNYHQCGHSN